MSYVIVGYIILFNTGFFEPRYTHILPSNIMFGSYEECELNRIHNYKVATIGDIKKIAVDGTTCIRIK